MAKQKYYYVIAKKCNGDLVIFNSQLPIYWIKKIAVDDLFWRYGQMWTEFYTIQKIKVSDLESIIIKSQKA